MASVLDYIECPNCKHEASDDFYYKTGEEYVNCSSCGYHYSATIINRDKKLSELTESDWKIEEFKNPYGSYRISCYNSPGYTCGSLENEEQLNKLKQQLEESIHVGVEVEYFTISRFVDGEIKVETIIDNGPKYDSAGFSIEDRFESEAGGERDCGNNDDEGDFFN
jgi:Zn ribbon nucleic-acid-binding protein